MHFVRVVLPFLTIIHIVQRSMCPMEHTFVWPDERGRHCVEGETYLEAGTKPMWLFLVQRCQESQVQGDILFFCSKLYFCGLHNSALSFTRSLQFSLLEKVHDEHMYWCISSTQQGRQHCTRTTALHIFHPAIFWIATSSNQSSAKLTPTPRTRFMPPATLATMVPPFATKSHF